MSEASVVSVERLPSAVVIHVLPGELRTGEVDAICAAVDAAQAAAPAVPFVLDLSKVGFMGSHAMGVLLGLNSEFKARGQRSIFAGLQPYVLQSITVSRVNKVMEIAADVEAAKRSATSQRPMHGSYGAEEWVRTAERMNAGFTLRPRGKPRKGDKEEGE